MTFKFHHFYWILNHLELINNKMNRLEVGHRVRLDKKIIDNTKVFNEEKCVIHLIDLSDIREEEDFDINNILDIISNFITDQHMELWRLMKKGDFIEDISVDVSDEIGQTKRLFIVDNVDNVDSKDLNVIRHGLGIKNLCTDYDKFGSIYSDMYTITEFSIGYFDDFVVNDYLCPYNTSKMYWHFKKSPVCFNVSKLKLNKLINDNVFSASIQKESYLIEFLYIIIKYKNDNYMIIREFSNEYFKYDMKKEETAFIDIFKKSKLLECYELSDNIKILAEKENIQIKNVCHV